MGKQQNNIPTFEERFNIHKNQEGSRYKQSPVFDGREQGEVFLDDKRGQLDIYRQQRDPRRDVGLFFQDESKYDEGIPYKDVVRPGGIQDWRASEQGRAAMWANTIPQFVTTAVTSFADSMLGTAFGILSGEGVDNAFTNLMLNTQDFAAETFPIYKDSEWEERTWYQNLGRSQFWADIIVNQGFTAGTVAAAALTGFIGRGALMGMKAFQLGRGVAGASHANKLKGIGAQVRQGQLSGIKLNKELLNAGRNLKNADIAVGLASSMHGSAGYARIEALGHGRQMRDQWNQELEEKYNSPELIENITQQVSAANPGLTGIELRRATREELESRRKEEQSTLDQLLQAHINTTFGQDLFYLTLTNQAMFGRLFRGNYGMNRGMYSKMVAPKAGRDAVMRDPSLLKEGIEAVKRTGISRYKRPLSYLAKNPAIQFFEESFLHINRETSGDFYKAIYDEEGTKDLSVYRQSYLQMMAETFGNIDNWESGMMGFFGGLFGAAGPVTRGGRVTGYSMTGGIWDAGRALAQGEQQMNSKIIDAVNTKLQDDRLQKMYRSAVRRNALEKKADAALSDADKFEYDNTQFDAFLNDLFLFDDLGLTQEFLDYINTGQNTSPEQLRELFAMNKDSEGNKLDEPVDIFEGMEDSELKSAFSQTSRELRQFADNALKARENLAVHTSQRTFIEDDPVKNSDMQDQVLKQLIRLSVSMEHMEGRISKVRSTLPASLAALGDEIFVATRENDKERKKELDGQIKEIIDGEAGTQVQKRKELFQQLDEYAALLTRMNRFGEIYEALESDEGSQKFIEEVNRIRDNAKKKNEALQGERTIDDVAEEQGWHPTIKNIVESVTAVSQTTIDGEIVTEPFAGQVKLFFSDKDGVPTGESAVFAVEEVRAKDGKLGLREVFRTIGEEGTPERFNKKKIWIDGEGNVEGRKGTIRFDDWAVHTTGEQAKRSIIKQRVQESLKPELDKANAELNRINTRIASAETFKNNINKAIQEYQTIPDKFKETKELHNVNIADKRFRETLKRTLSKERYRELNVETATAISLTVSELEGTISELNSIISELETSRNSVQQTLNNLQSVITDADFGDVTQLESTVQDISTYMERNQEALDSAIIIRDNLNENVRRLKSSIKEIDKKIPELEQKKKALQEATQRKLQSEDSSVREDIEVEIDYLKSEIKNLYNEKVKFEHDIFMDEATIKELNRNIENTNSLLAQLKEGQKIRDRIIKNYNSIVYGDAVKKATQDKFKATEAETTDIALQEEYEQVREEDTGIYTPVRDPRPVQRFTNSVANFQRTTTAQHKFLDDKAFYEPQLRFQNFIDSYNPSKNSHTLKAYTLTQLKQAFKEGGDLVDGLTEDQKKDILQGAREDNYSVYFVVADKKGIPVKLESFKEDGSKTIMLSYMPDLKNRDGVYENQRPESKYKIVDLENQKAKLINKQKLTEENAEALVNEEFVERAKEFDNTIRQRALDSKSPMLFQITGRTKGFPETTSVLLTAAEVFVPPDPTQSTISDKEHIKQLKDLTINTPISNERVTDYGEAIPVKKGFVYVEQFGTIFPAQRVTLSEDHMNRIVGALRHLMLNQSQENYKEVHNLINTYTYYINESKAETLAEDATHSRFHIISKKDGSGFWGVQMGTRRISAEELLSNSEDINSTILEFLSDKFYNVDNRRLKSNKFKTIDDVKYQYDEQGNVSNVELSTTMNTGYKDFIFGAKPHNPKLLFNIPKFPTTTAEAIENPRFINRSFTFKPLEKESPTKGSTEKTTAKQSTKTTKPGDVIKGKVKAKSVDKEAFIAQTKEYKENVEGDSFEVIETSEGKTNEQKEAITGQNYTGVTISQEEVAKHNEIVQNKEKKETVKHSQEDKQVEQTKKFLDKTDYDFDAIEIEFTLTSDSPSHFGNINLEAERAKFKRIFRNVEVYSEGLEAMNSDAMLDTMDGIVKVLVNPNAAEGTLWHEGFHIVNLLFNSTGERQALYNELRDYLGNKEVKIGKDTLKGKELNNVQAEEYLAEQFRSYMLTGKNNYKFPKGQQKKRTFFERIWNSVMNFFGLSNEARNQIADQPFKILEQFDKIPGGVYDVQKLENVRNVRVNKIGNNDEATSKAMLSGLNSVFFNTIFRQTKFTPAELIVNLENYVGGLYKATRKTFEKQLERLQKQEGRDEEGVKFVTTILRDWDKLITKHFNTLKNYKIDVNQFEDFINSEERSRDTSNWFESNRIDHRKMIEVPLRILLASISDYGVDGNKVRVGGVPQSINSNKLINKLHVDLANVPNYATMIEIMETKSEEFPAYKEILDKLETSSQNLVPENIDSYTVNIQNAFYHQFSKSMSGYNTFVLGEGDSYFVESVSQTAENRLIDTWKNNIKVGLEETLGLFHIEQGRHRINPEGTVTLFGKNYKVKALTPDQLRQINKDNPNTHQAVHKDFLRAFGIHLDASISQFNSLQILSENLLNATNTSIKKNNPLFVEEIFDKDVVKINKELKELASEQTNLEHDVVLGQFMNAKGQTEYAIKLKHYVDHMIDMLESGQIPEHAVPFDGTTGNYLTYGSRWLNRTDVRRTILRNLGMERGDKVDLDALQPGDYSLLQMEAALNGIYPYMRSADRPLEVGFNFGKRETVLIKPENFRQELEHYLEAELVHALAFINTPEYQHFNKGRTIKGLGFFKDILKNIDKELQRPQYKNLNKQDFIPTAKQIISDNKGHIEDKLDNYVQEVRHKLKRSILRTRIVDEGKGDSFEVIGFPKQTLERLDVPFKSVKAEGKYKNEIEKLFISEETLNNIVDTINYHYTTSGIEQTKLITGALGTYMTKAEPEFHIRNTLFTSTSNSTRNDQSFIDAIDRLYPRMDMFVKGDTGRRTNYYKDIVVQDMNVKSKNYEMFKAVIGEKADAYLKQTENDAAGIAFLDGFRDYELRTTGQWNESKEITFQYESQLLFQKFLEKGYITEVEYREAFKDHVPRTEDIDGKYFYDGKRILIGAKPGEDRITKLEPFSVKKPISRGEFANEALKHSGQRQTTKPSISLMLPSDYIHSDDAIAYMHDAMLNGIDFVFPVSAKKTEYLGNSDGQVASFYNEDGTRNKISDIVDQGQLIERIYWDAMGDQQEIDPHGHNVTADSSQKRTLTYVDAFDGGKAVPGKENITKGFQEYVNLYNAKIDKEIEGLVDRLGLSEERAGEFKLVDNVKFLDTIISEMNRRELPENSLEAVKIIFESVNELKFFDSIPTKRQLVNLLQGLVRNKTINLKTSGDMLVQESVIGREIENRSNIAESSDILNFYGLIDADGNETNDLSKAVRVRQAEIMVSLQREWIPFINTFPGKTFEDKLKHFNDVEIHKEKYHKILSVAANRIPSDHLHSIEAMKIVKFLSPQGGPRVVLPTDIVTKTGSDFDIDKLSTYLNNVRFVNGEPIYEEYITDKNQLWNNYNERIKNTKKAKELLDNYSMDVYNGMLLDSFRDMFNSQLTDEQRQSIHELLSSNIKVIHEEVTSDAPVISKEDFMQRSVEELNSKEAIENRLGEISQQVLLDPKNFATLITPNNMDAVKAIAKDPTITDVTYNSLLELPFNNNVAFNQFEGKALIGITMNNNSAHALQQIFPIRITSPAFRIVDNSFSKTPGNLFFGHYQDQKKAVISENHGALATAALDAGKLIEPFVIRANFTRSTANTYSYLNRLGNEQVDPMSLEKAAAIITSPVVVEFERRRRINEAEFLKNKDLNLEKRQIFDGLLQEKNITLPREYKPLYKLMEDYIKVAMHPDAADSYVQEAEQTVIQKIQDVSNLKNNEWKNLELFLYYQESAKLLNSIQQLTRPDAGLPKDRNIVKLRERKLDRILKSGLVDPSSINDLLEKSYLKNFRKAHKHSERMFSQFYISEASNEFNTFLWGEDGIIQTFENPKLNIPEDKLGRIVQKIGNATISYILHTTKVGQRALNERYGELMKGENSLAKRVGRAKTVPELSNNPALVEFVSMVQEYDYNQEKQHEIDYIKMFNRKYSAEETDSIVEGIRELLNHEDSEVRKVGEDLIDVAFVQSGVQISPISFFELLPADRYYERFMNIMNNYFEEGPVLNEHAKNEIFANLVHDRNIVQRARRFKTTKEGILINKESPTSEYEFVVHKEVLYKKTIRSTAELSDAHYLGIGNFQKFVPMNTKGDGQRMFEAYRTNNISTITYNNKVKFEDSKEAYTGKQPISGEQLSMFTEGETLPTTKGINIRTDKTDPNSLANRLTNPNWYAKDLFNVEAAYKASASRVKAPHLKGEKALKYDMNVMYRLQLKKFRQNPELIDEINEVGGLNFIKASSHIVGVKDSRWEGVGMESNFIKVLAKSYETVAKELNKFEDSKEAYTGKQPISGEQLSMFTEGETLPSTQFTTSTTSGYPERTRENASADATIAIAVDFTSAGERLTKKSVLGQNKRYISVDANKFEITQDRVEGIAKALDDSNVKSLNIAGNGIYTMKGKYTQKQVDDFTYELISKVHAIHPIESIRTGGQTGLDEAGAKAGMRLGIPTRIHAPKDWAFKKIDGTTVRNEQAFKARFEGITPDQRPERGAVTQQPIVDTTKSWSKLKTQAVYTDEGVNTMRTSNKEAEHAHFGNPSSEAGYAGTIKVPSVKIAMQEYKDWLLGDAIASRPEVGDVVLLDWGDNEQKVRITNLEFLKDGYKLKIINAKKKEYIIITDSIGNILNRNIEDGFVTFKDKKLTDKFEPQRKWILEQINDGKLDGATLLYDDKLAARGKGTHAHALAEVVQEIRGTQRLERDDTIYYQQERQTDLAPNKKLNDSLHEFLDKIGVTYKSVDTIVDNLGKTVGTKNEGTIAVARIAQKTVEVIEGRADRTTLGEESAHFYVELLQDNDPLLTVMKKQIENFEVYNEVKSEYGELYKDNMDKIKKEAIAKVIASKLAGTDIRLNPNQVKQTDNWFRAIWRKVKNIFKVSDDPFKQAAYNILNKNIENLDTSKFESPEASEFYQANPIQQRLDMLDDVAQAQKYQQERVRRKEQSQSDMEQRVPEESSQKREQNEQELRKVSEEDFAIQEIFTNFEKYFPHYEGLNNVEKIEFIESMNILDILC